MSDDLRDILPVLEPPAGGLGRLRARIRDERRGAPRWAVVAAAAALAVGVLVARDRATPAGNSLAEAVHDPVLVALAEEGEPVRLLDRRVAAAARVPTTTPGVIYYRVLGLE
jgi:hypothetical protein